MKNLKVIRHLPILQYLEDTFSDDIFDKIKETKPGFNGEIQLTDAMSKLDEIHGVKFTGKVFNIENRLEWIKSSINYAMADDEFKDDLVNYMKTFAG